MYKLIKILLGLIAAIIILCIISIVMVFTFVNPNNYKARIANAISAQTNHRKVTLAGDLHWSFFPWFGLKLNQVILGNQPDFDQKTPFLTIENVQVSFKFIPLLMRQIEFSDIDLQHVKLNLVINSRGQNNWSYFTAADPEHMSSKQPSEAGPPFKLFIANLSVSDGQINWQDQRTNQQATLTDFSLHSSHINNLNNAFPATLGFKLQPPNSPLILQTNLQGNFMLNPHLQSFQVAGLSLQTQWLDLKFPRKPLTVLLTAKSLIYDGIKDQLGLSNYVVSNDNLNMQGSLEVDNFAKKTPQAHGDLKLQVQTRALLQSLGYTMAIKADNKLLTQLTANMQLQTTSQQIDITQLQGQFDQTHFAGGAVINTTAPKQINFDLKLNKINLDDYAALKINSPTAAHDQLAKLQLAGIAMLATATASTTKTASLPTTTKAPLVIQGQVVADQLVVNGMNLTAFKGHVHAQNNLINIAPFTTQLCGGSMSGSIAIDRSTAIPQYNIQTRLTQVDLPSLLASDRIQGKADINSALTMSGNTAVQKLNNLNGTLQLNASNGVLKGINLPQVVQELNKLLVSKHIPLVGIPVGDSPFSQLSASATIKQGVVNNSNLQLQAQNFKATGSGSINLVNHALNYVLNLVLTNTNNVKNAADIKGLSLPILITGTTTNPKLQPNYTVIAEKLFNQKITNNVNQVLDKTKNPKLKQALQNFLHKQ